MSAGAAPAGWRTLCPLDEIPDNGARGFTLGSGAGCFRLLVLRHGDTVRAFENACPHEGTPLDTVPDSFLTADGARLSCSTHGAQFRLEDGVCVFGPCKGKALKRVAAGLVDGHVVVGPW